MSIYALDSFNFDMSLNIFVVFKLLKSKNSVSTETNLFFIFSTLFRLAIPWKFLSLYSYERTWELTLLLPEMPPLLFYLEWWKYSLPTPAGVPLPSSSSSSSLLSWELLSSASNSLIFDLCWLRRRTLLLCLRYYCFLLYFPIEDGER